MSDSTRTAIATAALLGALGALPTQALAQDARALAVQSLAATCASCHGTGGRAVDGSVVPGLAGADAARMVEQMKAFKSGTRSATVMHQLAKGFSDAQIEAMAAWFAAQPRSGGGS